MATDDIKIKKITFRLTEDEYDKISAEAEYRDVTISEFMRSAINHYVGKDILTINPRKRNKKN